MSFWTWSNLTISTSCKILSIGGFSPKISAEFRVPKSVGRYSQPTGYQSSYLLTREQHDMFSTPPGGGAPVEIKVPHQRTPSGRAALRNVTEPPQVHQWRSCLWYVCVFAGISGGLSVWGSTADITKYMAVAMATGTLEHWSDDFVPVDRDAPDRMNEVFLCPCAVTTDLVWFTVH